MGDIPPIFKFYLMSFLDGLSSAVGAAGGSLLGGLMDTSNREYLMQKQDKINKENATIAYNRQRELTQDQALLHKRGMEQAGYNTAFGSSGNVTSSANVDQASPVSVPSPQGYGQQLSTAFGSFLQNSLVNAQRRNVDADTNAKNIDNATRAIKNALEIGKQKQDIGVSMLNYAKDAFKFAVDQQYYSRQQAAQTEKQEADAKRAESLKAIEEVNAMFQYSHNEAELQKAYQEFENLKKVYDLTDAQIVTEKGKPRVQLSEINKNNASADESRSTSELNKVQTEGFKLNNQYLSQTLADRVEQQGYDTLIKKVQSLPHSYRDIVMRSHQWQVMCYKLEHNQALTEQETKNLDELLKLDSYDPNKNASNWINFINKMK
nr:MAG TPA: hypothetical protein [Microviridae sp.]